MASSGLVNDCFFHSQASIHVSDYSRAPQNVLQRFWEMSYHLKLFVFHLSHVEITCSQKQFRESNCGKCFECLWRGERRLVLFCQSASLFPHKKTRSLTPILWSGCGEQRGMKCTTRGWQAGESYSDCLTQKLCRKDMSHVHFSFLKMLSALFYETVK